MDVDTRARRLGNKFWGRFIGSRSMEEFRREAAKIIREAVEEEREACAQLVEHKESAKTAICGSNEPSSTQKTLIAVLEDFCKVKAAAIRAREKP